MKNYEEMTECVFERIHEYEDKQIRRRKAFRRIMLAASPVCIAFIIGAGFYINSLHKPPKELNEISSVNENNTENTVTASQYTTAVISMNTDTTVSFSETEVTDTVQTSDTVETTPAFEFRNYAESDFRTVNVPLTYTDKEAPVVLKSYDIPDLDFGERLAPCKTSDDPSQFDPLNYGGYRWIDNDGVEHLQESTYMQMLDTPEKGAVRGATLIDNLLYMLVNYDHYCNRDHEWSVFSYNTDTQELKEVYNYSGIDTSFSTWTIPDIVGKYMVLTSWEKEPGTNVNIIDLETGERKTIYSSDHLSYINTDGKEKIQICESEHEKTNKAKLTIKDYNINTEELTTLTENEELKLYSSASSELNAYLRKPLDARRCQLVTEHYTIDTGVTNADILYVSDKKAIIMTTGMSNVLHTFDLEKMEHYVTDVGEIAGSYAAYGENIVIGDGQNYNDSQANVYYLMPEMGLVFTLAEQLPYISVTSKGGTVTLSHEENELLQYSTNGGQIGYHRPVTVYWIEDK